jgi:C1A family cysteine protease
VLCMGLPLLGIIAGPVVAGQPADLHLDPGTPRCFAVLPPGTGYIPPGIDLSHIAAPMAGDNLALPSAFDWREAGKVTSVKNQGSCGSCYAFAAIAAFESRALIVEDSTFDFSENNVKECEWYRSSCNGGNDWLVANYLTTAGTVMEACDPYVAHDVACEGGCPYRRTLIGWGVISGNTIPSVDILKSYIETYGPVYTTMYSGSGDAWRSEFAAYNGSYTLYHQGQEIPNHAVLIVGWDDDLPHAGGQGAWIVKNSWGSGWGGTCGYGSERGYFTIAYGSASIGANSSIPLEWEVPAAEDTILYYDEGGAGGRMGFIGSRTAWGLCKYVPYRSVSIERVEFWTLDATTDVDVYIFDDFGAGAPSGLLASSLDLHFDLAGYHSAALETPLPVAGGEDVYVVVKVTNANSYYTMSYDTGGPDAPGRSYLSADGSYFFEFTPGDLGIRLRGNTGSVSSEILEDPAITEIRDVEGDSGGYVSVAWRRSSYDSEGGNPRVNHYRVWRKRRGTLSTMLGTGNDPQVGGPYEHGLDGPAWEVIGTVPASGSCCYELIASTECDASGPDTCWSYFCVTAHTGAFGEHFDSAVERGYSVDDGGVLSPPGGGNERSESGEPDVRLRTPEPNPAGERFLIRFDLGSAHDVEIAVCDVMGRRRADLVRGRFGPGSHAVHWDPETGGSQGVVPGVYFVCLDAEGQVRTEKVILVR